MDEEDLTELTAQLSRLPVPAMLTELRTRRFVAVNEAAAELFGVAAPGLVGTDVLSHVHPAEREATDKAYGDLESRIVDAYQASRRVVRPDGLEMMLQVWDVEARGGPYGLWILGSSAGRDDLGQPDGRDLVLAVTDHDWQFAYVSTDAHLLGGRGPSLVGQPVLGLVHPLAMADFLSAVTRATERHMAISVVTRLRVAAGKWVDRICVIAPMCEHDPPRLGMVVISIPAGTEPKAPIDREMQRWAEEARALTALELLPVLARHPSPPELSARQLEVLAHAIAGERVEDMARSLYLSPSTLRNHLSAIYRKFGVHSRSQLLAALLRASSSQPE